MLAALASARRAASPSRVRFTALFAALLALAAWLALGYRYPPLVDWPEHLAQDAVFARLHDPSYDYARYYQTSQGFLPYLGFRVLHAALSRGLGIELGARVALLGYLVGTPLAVLALVRRSGRDPWLALGAFVVLIDANFLWGFAPHGLGTTLCLAAIALTLRALARGGAVRTSALALLGIALCATHAHQTAVWLLSVGAIAIVARRRGAASGARVAGVALATIPAATLLGIYLCGSGWLSGTALRDEFATVATTSWRTPYQVLRSLAYDSGLLVLGPWPWCAFVVATAVVWLAAWRERDANESAGRFAFAPGVLAAAWCALLFVLPTLYRSQTVAPRVTSLALLGLLLAPAWSARPSLGHARTRVLARGALLGCALLSLLVAHARFASFDRAMRPLDTVLAAIPPRSRVATLAYELYAPESQLPTLLHLGGYALAARGGLAGSGFTRTGVSYARGVPREQLLVHELWAPAHEGFQLDLARYGAFYDAVIVVTGGKYRGSPFTRDRAPGLRAERVLGAGRFELWRVVRGGR